MGKNVLIVAAHPDDEALGCAGTMAKHVASGDKVHVIFMTNGVGSRNTTSNSDIENRQAAARKSADILGVTSMEHFDFPDNKMDTVSLLDIVKSIENVINKLQPEIIYTHHIGDLNIDHQITHRAVITACRPEPGFSVKELYSFEVLSATHWQSQSMGIAFTPNYFVNISDYIGLKIRALRFYDEEMRDYPHIRSYDSVENLSKFRGSLVGIENAEAFCIERLIK